MIFSNLSFTLNSHEALIIRGPNGAGKSTLLRAVAQLLPLASGEITLQIKGQNPSVPVTELCHYLGTDNAMKPAMSVEENLLFWQRFYRQPHMEIEEALAFVGLEGLESVPFGHLSTGQRRRIAIARLLVSYRPLWLLDEPTTGLDKNAERQFAALMEAHIEDGGMILAATHIPLDIKQARSFDFFETKGAALDPSFATGEHL